MNRLVTRIYRGIIISALLLSPLPLAAQSSSLNGVVTDAHGAAIVGAAVKVTNADTTATRAGVSNASGEYELVQLPPGPYKLTVSNPGFRIYSTSVVLQTNTPLTLDIRLEVGAATETVNVTADASAVNTENASIGNPFTETQIKEIPLQTRNIVALLGIQPGVASTGQVAGARPDQNNVLLDGVDVNDNAGANGFNAVVPIPLDSVQEFRTTVAGMGAEQGSYAGGQVSLITKSGSNQFHGTLYEYNRNTALTADSWFSNRAGVPRSALVRNQYGASVGGPIIKNKLFFFYNWEGRKDRSADAVNRTVPSDTLKQGEILVLLKSGQTATLGPAAITAIDPLGIGESAYMKSYLGQYPSGNNPLASQDKGLNFNVLTFNAPQDLNNHAQVGKLDYILDPAGKHTFSLRGTLNGAAVDGNGQAGSTTGLAEFPGQSAVQKTLDNSRGLGARYTAVLSPTLINVVNYGYTRLGTASTGSSAVVPTFYFSAPVGTTRGTLRDAPTTNFTDDVTWTKGRHVVTFGLNFRFTENDNANYSNSFPSYSFNKNTLLGLGGDLTTDVTNYLAPTYGSSVALSSATNVANAFGPVLGLLNQFGATYNYTSKGTVIPFGSPVVTAFEDHEYEGYIQDQFKFKPNFTVTVGLRYSLAGVPYELHGTQVIPTTPLNQFFADRIYAAKNGIPNSQLATSLITYNLGGPVNNGPGYYPLDKKDWAPRFALAYSPDSGSLLERIMGKGSAFRAGWAIVYDHYGTAMAQALASGGSPGLATSVAQPVNTNYTTAFRDTGNGYPTLPTVAGGSFPLTPAIITGGFTTFTGVSSTLKAPYSYLTNASYARKLPKKLTLELGYIGRIGKRQIVNQDYGQPLTNFADPASGQTFAQAGAPLAYLYDTGLTAAQVKANPSLVPNEPFFNNMFGKLANFYIPGSASANFFYDVYSNYAGSWLDGLNDVDRIRQSNGGCLVKTGCNTFFPLQNSGLDVYTNNGFSNYNAMTISFRRPVSDGWGFDFNYTWGHALDNGSASESNPNSSTGTTTAYGTGSFLQDAFNPRAFYGTSDFDARHTITADAVVEIPIGKGKRLFSNVKPWVNQIIGGWQATTLVTFRTGSPLTVTDTGDYNVNYDISAYGVLAPGVSLPASKLGFDTNGIPSIFANPTAVNSFVGSNPGVVGSRGILTGPHFFNTDIALSKSFTLPWEKVKLSFRAEAFNAFNNVEWGTPNVSLANPTTFGEITAYAPGAAPRVMQMALRLSF
jgi:hypothetical protein